MQASVPPPAPAPSPVNKDAVKKDAKAADEEPAGPDAEAVKLEAVLSRAHNKAERQFRIGLRQGENEIVVKVVFGSGTPNQPTPGNPVNFAMSRPGGSGAFTFSITPEGDDVVNHEVATALRLGAQEPLGSSFLELFTGLGSVPAALPRRPPAHQSLQARRNLPAVQHRRTKESGPSR